MKPIIGMPSDQLIEVNPRMPGDYPVYAPHDMKEAIMKARGIPIILPFPDDERDAEKWAKEMAPLYDGLLIPGGPDIDPRLFGQEPIKEIGMTYIAKDLFELALIKETLAAGKPILGICHGLQIINVALGGTVYQDIHTQDKDAYIQHAQATIGNFLTHTVNIKEGTVLHDLMGDQQQVNSRHHQAAWKVAPSLKVSAAAPDGVIEGLESKDSDQIVTVQWHPENLVNKYPDQFKLFENFIARVNKYKEGKSNNE